MKILMKIAQCSAALGAMFLCVPAPIAAQRAEIPRAPSYLSREELVGLVHCLRHCKGGWIDSRFEGARALHLRYRVEEWDPTRSGFYIVATVYSEKANSGLYFDLTWDGKRCGQFAVINDGQFTKRHGVWRWTTTPLGGIGTLKEATSDLQSVMSRGHPVTIDADTHEKGCGDWSTSV
jgi:hypothetical protein